MSVILTAEDVRKGFLSGFGTICRPHKPATSRNAVLDSWSSIKDDTLGGSAGNGPETSIGTLSSVPGDCANEVPFEKLSAD